MTILKGWKYGVFLGTVVGVIGLALYPIVVYPMLNSSEYKKIQLMNRQTAGIKQEEIQPGNMKIWSDPFERKK